VDKTDTQVIANLTQEFGSVVAKPIHSRDQGLHCKKIEQMTRDDEIREIIADIPGPEIIIQEMIEYKKLIRTIVIGFQMLRDAVTFDVPTEDWKASVCLNPKIKKYNDHSEMLVDFAERTARALEAEISFIDFFEDKNGHFILNELNTDCDLSIHEQITGVKIHEYIANYLMAATPGFGGDR
jgi:glutathione synthase/RimK-type ligase-like ATP-grasp enzyme